MRIFNCMELTQCVVFLALTLLTSNCCCSSFRAVTENDLIDTEISRSENLLCKTPPDERIRICWWTHSDFGMPNEPLNLFEFMKGNVSKGNVNFLYYGKGLENGDCGIQIAKMETQYLGIWNCTLVAESNNVFLASVQVKLPGKKITPKTIELDRSSLQNLLIDNKTGVVPSRNISCCTCSCANLPRPKLSFLLDQVPLETNIKTTDNDTVVCLWLEAQLKVEDDGKLLQCEVRPNEDELLTDSIHLDIKYAPVIFANSDPVVISIPSDAETATISIEFSGNPTPDITWQMKKTDESETFLTVLDNGNKYNVHRKFFENHKYVAELIIKELQEQDVEYEYILKVTNEYGCKTVTAKLDYENLSNWLLIVGAVLLAIFAIVTISLLIWAAKTRRFCCQRRNRLPITSTKPAPRHVQKYSGTSYKKAPTVDCVDTVPEEQENDTSTSTIPKPRSSIETEIR